MENASCFHSPPPSSPNSHFPAGTVSPNLTLLGDALPHLLVGVAASTVAPSLGVWRESYGSR